MTAIATRRADPARASAADLRAFWNESVDWLASHYLQILIAVGVAAVIVALLAGVRSLGMRLCARDRTGTHWQTTIGRAVARTRPWFMVAFAARLVSGYAAPPELVAQTINVAFTIAATLQIALWARELVLGIIEHRAGDADHGTLGSAMGIIRLLVTVVLFAIAVVVILDNLGVNVTGLIAGLGIGGIAIGLAAKGIFDDLFSALSIIFDKPFRRGDAIRWDGTSGTVEAIGLKSTRVRAITGEEVVISNTNLLGKELHNMARLARRRHILMLGVIYQTPPDVLAAIPGMVKEIVEREDKCIVIRCGMTGFGTSSLDFELQFDVMSENYDEVFLARSNVCLAILRAFNDAGIEFAYPTQTSFTAAPDGTLVLPYAQETRLVHEETEERHG
jgi:small-conductance mechanosensitive channel